MLRIETTGKSQMKSRNRVRVFREILKNEGVSRKQLEKILSLSAPSITRVVEELMREGLIYEEGTEQTLAGRRPVMLSVKKGAYYSIGMNLTRSSLYYCVKNIGSETVYSNRIRMNGKKRGDEILAMVDSAISEVMNRAGIDKTQLIGIGIASRGTVDRERGGIIYSPDSGEEIWIKDHLKESFDCTVLVENNVVADLKGQYLDMNDANRNLVYLYLSDGVGGSIICNGEVVDGESSMAGKFAHILVETDGRMCTCGKRGHLESYVSSPALEEEYFLRTGRKKRIELTDICHLANEGDPTASQVLDEALEKLAIGVAQILVILNPGTLVFYGEVFEEYQGVLERLKEKTAGLSFADEMTQICWIVRKKENVKIEESIAGLVVEKALTVLK